jgi:transposase
MSERTRYVGLDVHKASISVAVAEAACPPEAYGRIANDPSSLRRLMQRLGAPDVHLRVVYEAGPTGYAVHRQLSAMGIECMVVAPSLIPKRPGDRVKTDRRDALKLARLLRSGDLVPVWVPDEEHEALRDLVRTRADAKADVLRAKHRLSKFLLRRGLSPAPDVKAWTCKHAAWLNGLTFAQAADQVVLDDYRAAIRVAEDRVVRLEQRLVACAANSRHAQLIAALQSLRGIAFLSAVTIVAEVGDFRRFRTPRQLMGYVGVVPSEYSSGAAQHRGHITKVGNSVLRHVLGEAAHHARRAPSVSAALRQRQANLPADTIEHAWRAQLRLHARYRHLAGRVGKHKALTAVSRELAGFVWAIGTATEATAA